MDKLLLKMATMVYGKGRVVGVSYKRSWWKRHGRIMPVGWYLTLASGAQIFLGKNKQKSAAHLATIFAHQIANNSHV